MLNLERSLIGSAKSQTRSPKSIQQMTPLRMEEQTLFQRCLCKIFSSHRARTPRTMEPHMELPLLERVMAGDDAFHLTASDRQGRAAARSVVRLRFQYSIAAASRAGRAIPLSLRYDQVHRLQVLRGGLQ